jgi:uncharacterized protein (DUF1697 family)
MAAQPHVVLLSWRQRLEQHEATETARCIGSWLGASSIIALQPKRRVAAESRPMQPFVILLRGINVGSTRKLPMADLRALCTRAGWNRPETYIQSGNLIVDADDSADELRRSLAKAVAARFGFTIDIVARAAADWEKYVAANPFVRDADVLPKMMHLYLSRDPVKSGAAKELEQKAQTGERIVIAGGVLWIDYGPKGIAASKLSPLLIDKACGSPTTGRNWNTVLKIREMIEARR